MSVKLDIIPLKDWFPGYKRPLIISGPCSAETEEQLFNTIRKLKQTGIQIIRAGIWKPRTRPNMFEGVGKPGLQWLKTAGIENGLLTSTEVANAEHVEEALKAGIDILWIGARTTVNPFSVQEIADALEGTDIPVFVKNPVNADLQLWIGALERINKTGIKRIAAIHRGFSSMEKKHYRNAPMWEIPIELKTLIPELDIICDPSHICGRRDTIQEVAQKALDLDFSGLMIESHICPDEAWSDAQQQVTPVQLAEILGQLVVREKNNEDIEFSSKLEELRAEIDKIDEAIVQYISTRMDVAEKIGEYKRDNNVTILQLKRWEEILNTRSSLGKVLGLSDDFLKKYLELIHKESIKRQTSVMNQKPKLK
ncbi:MAG: chorismate mutase [Bacteroidota bacterium]